MTTRSLSERPEAGSRAWERLRDWLAADWRSALITLALVFVIGYALSFVLSLVITRNALEDVEISVGHTLSARVASELTIADLDAPLSGERLETFQTFLDTSVRTERTVELTLWNAAGTVIYSDDDEAIGAMDPLHDGDELREALGGEIVSELARSDARTNLDGTAIEVYAPIRIGDSSDVDGVLEVYEDYTATAANLAEIQRYVTWGMVGGLFAAYLILMSLVHRRSRQIRRQRDLLGQQTRELRSANQALTESEQRFRALVQNSSDVIWELDDDFRVRQVGEAVVQIMDRSPDAMLGDSILDHSLEADIHRLRVGLSEAAASGEGVLIEHRVVGALGRTRILESNVTDFRHDPAVGTIVVNSRDITDRVELEDRVEAAEEMGRLKSEFVAIASHELRTPLTGILGYSALLHEADGLSSEERGWADTISNESERLAGIVDQLLNTVRIESGEQRLEIEAVALAPMVAKITTLQQIDARDRALQLLEDVPADLSAAADTRVVSEILTNLVSNAIKYSPKGGTLTVSGHTDGDWVELAVSDTGLGIPEDALATIFDRFTRVDLPDRAQIRGTGLGLFIVHELVARLGGSISVESQLRHGSTFTIRLPAASTLGSSELRTGTAAA